MTKLPAIVKFSDVSMQFGNVLANDRLNFEIYPGTIHAVIGENGAGKSTAMKLLYGMHRPTSGQIYVQGKKISYRSPRDAVRDGIGMVHQHFMLSSVHTALENVVLSTDPEQEFKWWPSGLTLVKRTQFLAKLETLTKSVGFNIPWDRPVEELPVGIQQQIEISKLLVSDVNLLILDEPTAVLSPLEITSFFSILRTLRQQGKTIVIITHKLQEVLDIAERVTIMRSGQTVSTMPTAGSTIQSLADLMVGRHVDLGAVELKRNTTSKIMLEAKHLTIKDNSKSLLQDVSFQLKSGEILGVAGIQGNGQTDLVKVLYAPRTAKKRWRVDGDIRFGGLNGWAMSTKEIRKSGVGVIGADRHRESVILNFSLWKNLFLGMEISFYGVMAKNKLIEQTKKLLDKFSIRANHADTDMRDLSGGNQQKFVVARELSRNPKILLCSEPTRGVDVGSIEQIHHELRVARDSGTAIMLVSSQLEELMALSDRIIVMTKGSVAGEFVRGKYDEKIIGRSMLGVGASNL